jgi:membrane protease subunit HflK
VVDSKANSMMYLPIDKLINSKQNTTQATSQSSQEQAQTPNDARNVFRNRGVR